MKKLILVLLSLLMLVSCTASDTENAPSSGSTGGNVQPESSDSAGNKFAGTTIRISDPRFSAGD